jgi:hypothetical protein
VALLVVVLSLSAVLALGLGLALAVDTETDIVASTHGGAQVALLAWSAAERAMSDLGALPAWSAALAGAATSSFHDGETGRRTAAGLTLDLGEETARLTCGLATCAGVSPSDVTADRPWGVNNPEWRVFASGRGEALLGRRRGVAGGYVVVWIGDDPSETDGDARTDGGPPASGSFVNPGAGVVWLRVVAWGPRASRHEIDLVVERDDHVAARGARVRAWRVLRGASP